MPLIFFCMSEGLGKMPKKFDEKLYNIPLYKMKKLRYN